MTQSSAANTETAFRKFKENGLGPEDRNDFTGHDSEIKAEV
jgi:hypothetical protein